MRRIGGQSPILSNGNIRYAIAGSDIVAISRFARALQEESAARTEYMRILRIFNELTREGTLPEEAPGLFLVDRETGSYLHCLSTMNEEDQETPLQEMDAQQLAEKTAWLRLFVRQASKRGYTTEDIGAKLDEPGMTANEAVGRILSARKPK